MLQLAARTWQLEMAPTIQKLRQHGLEIPADTAAITTYIHSSLKQRRLTKKFWKETHNRPLHSSTSISRLLQEQHLTCAADRWAGGPGRMVGWSPKGEIARLYHPRCHRPSTGGDRAGRMNIFRGVGWGDVLVLPFYDLPGRICGMLFRGRQGREEEDTVYRRRVFNADCSPATFEAGLHMHPEALDEANQWGGRVLAMGDPFRACQIQCKHFGGSGRPLPIVSFYQAARTDVKAPLETEHAWHWLSDKQVVVWMPTFDQHALLQAIRAGGEISTFGLKQEEWRTFLARHRSEELVRAVFAAAKPWPIVLGKWLRDAEDSVVENLFRRLQAAGLDVEQTLSFCPPNTRQRVQAILQVAGHTPQVTYDGVVIQEQGDTWQIVHAKTRRSYLMCNAILHIDQILNHPQAGKTYYRGIIRYQGKKIPFCDSRERIEADTFGWMSDTLLAADAGRLQHSQIQNKRAVQIAMAFRTPEYIQGVDTVGWDGKQGRFMLPQFEIRPGGVVHTHSAEMFAYNAPALQVPPPEPLSRYMMQTLTPGAYCSKVLWATTAAVIANILAPAFQEEPTGIGLHGAPAELAGEQVSKALGCRHMPITTKQHLLAIQDAEHEHNWPVHVLPIARTREALMQEWLDGDGRRQHNALSPLTWWQRSVLGFGRAWTIVETSQERNTVTLRQEVATNLQAWVSSYLQELSTRRMLIERPCNRPWVLQVLDDMVKFSEKYMDDPAVMQAAESFLIPYVEDGHAELLAQMLSKLVVGGHLAVSMEGYQKPGTPTMLQTDAGLRVDLASLRPLFTKQNVQMPSPARVSAVLAHAGVLREQHDTAWVIDTAWWTESHRQQTAVQAGQLRLHG